MPTLYNPFRKKGVFMIPAGGLGPSVSADFSYSKSSYHQDEADPTPTITGTPGGAFICTTGAVFVDTGSTSSSTGQIDLSASTIDTHLISYTVDSVTATANVGITPSPYLDNTYSMEFDGNTTWVQNNDNIFNGFNDFSISMWINADTAPQLYDGILTYRVYSGNYQPSLLWTFNPSLVFSFASSTSSFSITASSLSRTSIITGSWYHLTISGENGQALKLYINGVEDTAASTSGTVGTMSQTNSLIIGADIYQLNTPTRVFDGKIDEVAIWNTALSSDAVQEIYNATNNNTGKALDLTQDSGNYNASSNLQYFNRLGD